MKKKNRIKNERYIIIYGKKINNTEKIIGKKIKKKNL